MGARSLFAGMAAAAAAGSLTFGMTGCGAGQARELSTPSASAPHPHSSVTERQASSTSVKCPSSATVNSALHSTSYSFENTGNLGQLQCFYKPDDLMIEIVAGTSQASWVSGMENQGMSSQSSTSPVYVGESEVGEYSNGSGFLVQTPGDETVAQLLALLAAVAKSS
jgi:hypothetical protein